MGDCLIPSLGFQPYQLGKPSLTYLKIYFCAARKKYILFSYHNNKIKTAQANLLKNDNILS